MKNKKRKAVIDCYSTNWVHYDFNQCFTQRLRKDCDFDYYGYQNLSIGKSIKKPPRGIRLVYEFATKYESVIFMIVNIRDVWKLILLRLFFVRVKYIVHKYNIRSYKKNIFNSFIWKMLKFFGITGLYLDLKPRGIDCFEKIEIGLFEGFLESDPITPNSHESIKRLILIGSPDGDKNIEFLRNYSKQKSIKVLNVTNSIDEKGIFNRIEYHQYVPEPGDVIWGCYGEDEYTGIQSGLPFAAKEFSIPILTISGVGIRDFERLYRKWVIRVV